MLINLKNHWWRCFEIRITLFWVKAEALAAAGIDKGNAEELRLRGGRR